MIDKTPIIAIPPKAFGDKHFATEFNKFRMFLLKLADEVNNRAQGYNDSLRISDAEPTAPGLYKLLEFGTYINLTPAVDENGNPTTITAEDGKINEAYYDGTKWINSKISLPQYEEVNFLINNGEIRQNDFVQTGFIYHGTTFQDGSIQGDGSNKTTAFIPVSKGDNVKAKIAINSGGYAIGFYSQPNTINFVTGVIGEDSSKLVDYEFTCPYDGYVLVCTSVFGYPNAFTESYYAVNEPGFENIYITPWDLDRKEIKTFNYFAGHDQKPKSFNYQNASKKGLVITKSSSGFDNGAVESPYIIWDTNINKYVMVYTAYTSDHVGSIGWAISDDLLSWTKKGQLIQPSGIEANGDKYGMTGPCLTLYNGKYYLYYLGLNGSGYEGEPINLCLATSDSLETPNWNYEGIKIPIQSAAEWANEAIYHANIVKADNKWYIFF